jgi:hypothetical protein
MSKRLPRGYVGTNHETIGSDILAVLGVLRFPAQVLGAEKTKALQAIDPQGWYPIAGLLELMDTLEQKVGRAALFTMGETLFKMSHEEKAKQAFKSAKEILHAFDAIYKNANRGDAIGGWKVLSWAPGRCELEKTTPHHCVMEEGICHRALACLGVTAQVRQTQCFRQGADYCHYVITSPITDARWA